jgi:isopenicillin N synthase-like dioxygenase
VTTLPVIDIAPLRAMDDAAAVGRVAAEIGAASAEFGFFYVDGHGVADSLFARLETASRRFFALPEAGKAQIAMAHGGIAWRGWFPLGGELTSGLPDRKEDCIWARNWPPTIRASPPAGRCTAPICGRAQCPGCGTRSTPIWTPRLPPPKR